ncbi:MAG: DUF4906 domain-containing protein [Bacteroidales bacterium]|nr:DUF4906 domain-containing protein [Bacteroidales bacterium]
MKLKQYLLAAMLLPAVISCDDKNGPEVHAASEITISLECEGMQENQTKSSFTWADTYIHDYEVFVVNQDGVIEQCLYQNGSSAINFQARRGAKYSFFAVVNHGKKLTPRSVSEIDDLSKALTYSDIASYGIPMSGSITMFVTTSISKIIIPVTRLLARVDFKVDRSQLVHCDKENGFVVKSVKIFNGLNDSFDYSSAADITRLNDGGKISLYASENLKGTKLPNNNDPWSKVPSKDSGSEDCSYLEVEAAYSALGLSSDNITYRMYLGDDATTNFDVRRNAIYTLTLIPTEDEIMGEKGSWKIESRDWSDSRMMTFVPYSISVPALGSASATINMTPAPFDVVFTGTEWLEEAGCVYSYDAKTCKLTVTNVEGQSEQKEGYIYAESWDGDVEAPLAIKIAKKIVPAKLTASKSKLDTWGGNSYPITFTYTDENGVSSTVTPNVTFSFTLGTPTTMLYYAGGKIVAQDWWGKTGAWTTVSPTYTAVFKYNGVSTMVTGSMHGVTGFKELKFQDGYFTKVTTAPAVQSAILTGSEDIDVTSSVKVSTSIASNSYVNGYLKVGQYNATCTVTDPNNGLVRTGNASFKVLTNIKTIAARLRVDDFSYYNTPVNRDIAANDGDTVETLYINTNGHDETYYSIQFADFRYTDIWGVTHSIGDGTPYYGQLPPLSKQTWGLMPLEPTDDVMFTLNGFTFYLRLVAM